jgi:hypothetical protein
MAELSRCVQCKKQHHQDIKSHHAPVFDGRGLSWIQLHGTKFDHIHITTKATPTRRHMSSCSGVSAWQSVGHLDFSRQELADAVLLLEPRRKLRAAEIQRERALLLHLAHDEEERRQDAAQNCSADRIWTQSQAMTKTSFLFLANGQKKTRNHSSRRLLMESGSKRRYWGFTTEQR